MDTYYSDVPYEEGNLENVNDRVVRLANQYSEQARAAGGSTDWGKSWSTSPAKLILRLPFGVQPESVIAERTFYLVSSEPTTGLEHDSE